MGLWHTDGSPNLGQKTRPYNNQQQKMRICKIVNFAFPAKHILKLKEWEKDKYLDLQREMKNLWNKKVAITLVVIGALCKVTTGLLKGLEELDFGGRVETIQTTALLRTARILGRFLGRLEETCCQSNSSERSSGLPDVKNSQRVNNNDNNNDNNNSELGKWNAQIRLRYLDTKGSLNINRTTTPKDWYKDMRTWK